MPRAIPVRRRARPRAPRVAVVGDLMLDVVVAPSRALELATDVPGRVALRQGGSAATTARWLARLGVRATLLCSVGRDPVGRALVAALAGDGVRVRATRVPGERTGRIGVVVETGGERSFVADRAAADRLSPGDIAAATFRVDLVHLPAYSLLGEPLGRAGRRAIELARAAGALVSLDLASVGPLLAGGRGAAIRLIRDASPDLIFATTSEARAVIDGDDVRRLGDFARIVVVKRGRAGATVIAGDARRRTTFDVATIAVEASDTTGAGDAFDAGFIATWLALDPDVRGRAAGIRRAVLGAHRAAARHLASVPRDVVLG